MGTGHIWHGKKRMTAHILSYRRIRRYLALSLKATEEHVTLVMWDPHIVMDTCLEKMMAEQYVAVI